MTDSAREVMESQWIYKIYVTENIFVINKSGPSCLTQQAVKFGMG